MIQLPADARGFAACGRSGLPLVAVCSAGHRRLVPFRLLRTNNDDRTPLYGRPFLCRACGSRAVTLFAIDSQAELDVLRPELLPPTLTVAPTTHAKTPPDADRP
jgi:hypothetical protein